MTSLPKIGPSFRGEKGSCSSARPRRRHASFAPRSATTPTTKQPIPGSSSPRPWSTSTTSTASIEDFGPFFLKFCTYFPYNAKLCINGHEYVKRQLAKEGIAFEALDNGIRSCANPQRAAADLRRPVRGQDRCACCASGWRDCRIRFAHSDRARPAIATTSRSCRASSRLTQVLDRPVSGRVFFEEVIRENLDIGRPDQVQLIFDRRVTTTHAGPLPHPRLDRGRHAFPAHRLQAQHASSSITRKVRRLRTETTINEPTRLRHRQAAAQPARVAGDRLPSQPTSVGRPNDQPRCHRGGRDLGRLQRPQIVDGQRVAALRFADPTVHALWHAMLLFQLLPAGFSNRQFRTHVAQPWANMNRAFARPHELSPPPFSLHGMIERIPKSHRYRLTDFGLRTAMFATRVWNRILRPGLGMVLPAAAPVPNPLLRTFDKLTSQIHDWADHAKLVA